MLSILFFAGVAFGNPWSQLIMKDAWKEELTYDWEELDHATAFRDWQKEFDKSYASPAEEARRFLIFLDNWKMINDHNADSSNSYTMKLNQFGDLTGDEFAKYVNGPTGYCLGHRSVRDRILMRETVPAVTDVPDAVDWTDVNGESYVTAVKNQGSCGSCWAFSTTGSIESAFAIKNGITGTSIPELSEQELVDCSGSYGNLGCNGGLMDDAFKYVEDNDGLCSESEYAYTGTDGRCQKSSCSTRYDAITGYKDVTHDSESALMAAVAIGPVSIAIEADQRAFQFYSGGVLDGRCGDSLDHGVLVVGYGTDGDDKFWKVKNSWGDSWGEDGYVRLCRDCNMNNGAGECGILASPSYPTL